ncbi:unnamed protein product [Oppiella nova]|uniref:Ras-associating domain-containing protein n=1 Tax=Oppiella nova TaxID=334625 RepID=A0A7R9M0A0_9ACAR|nr:unnamed protein product [Oppiella nova]CAG2168024.1 unnamed protein product [Oppiella nova]
MLKHVSSRTLNSLNVDTISINSSVLCGSSNGSANGCDEQTSRSSRSSSSTSIHDLGLQRSLTSPPYLYSQSVFNSKTHNSIERRVRCPQELYQNACPVLCCTSESQSVSKDPLFPSADRTPHPISCQFSPFTVIISDKLYGPYVVSACSSLLGRVVIKIHSRVLSSDVEYKTLSITSQTSSKEVVRLLLNKFKLKQRDPNLFYLTLEVWIRQTGIPIRSVMVLDDDTCPALLQSCYPQKDLKFSLMMRCGGLIKIYDSCLMSGSLYKSLLLSDRTTVEELIQLLLNCYNLNEKPSKFALFEVCPSRKCERKLCGNEIPLAIQSQWPNPDIYVFQLRRNTTSEEYQIRKRELPWSKTCDRSGNVMFHLNRKDEVNSASIHSPTLKPSFNNYENYFYI